MPRGSPTGMCQVNLDNENTRIVEEIAREIASRRTEPATLQPPVATAPAPAAAATAPAPAAASAPQFAHVAPTGARVNFSAEDSALIADAIEHSESKNRPVGDRRAADRCIVARGARAARAGRQGERISTV